MTSSQNGGTTLSTIERFEIPSFDEYDGDDMGNFDNDDEEGYVEVPVCGEEGNSLWDFPPFNDVSGLKRQATIEDYDSDNSQFNAKVLKEGGFFMRKELLMYACQKYSITHRREYHTVSSSTKQLVLECRQGKDKCKWELRASKKKNEGMWRVTKYEGDHTCGFDIIPHDNVHFNKHFIGIDIRDIIQEKLRFSAYEVQALMRSKYGYKISYMKAWKSRQKALVHIFGDWDDSFEKLPSYMDMLKESNPGTIVHWDTSLLESGKVSVNRVFWSFAPAIEGFKHYHRVCLRHFVSNFNQKAKCMAHKKLLYNIAEENQQIKFCNRSKDLRELLKDKSEVVKWLDKVDPETWALAFDSNGRRWGSMTTNQSESFNYVLMACRDLPITAIVHFTFKQVNSWFTKRRDEMIDWNNHHVPKIESMISANIEKAGRNEVQIYDRAKGIASVLTKSKGNAHKVSIIDKTCSCGKWQLFHYPCCHALAVCHQEGISIYDCVAYEYTTQAYNDTWAPTFNPVPDMRHWKHYDGPKHIPGKHYKRLKTGRQPTK